MLQDTDALVVWLAFALWTALAAAVPAALAYRHGWRDGARAQRDDGRAWDDPGDHPPGRTNRINRNMWE